MISHSRTSQRWSVFNSFLRREESSLLPNSPTKSDLTGMESISKNLEVDLESISYQVQVPAQAWACLLWEVKKKAWRHQTGRYQALVGYDGTLS